MTHPRHSGTAGLWWLCVLLILSGSHCASTRILYGGHVYSSSEDALSAQRTDNGKELKGIEPAVYRGGSCLIQIPPDWAAVAPPFTTRPIYSNEHELIKYFPRFYREDSEAIAEALRRSQMFDSVMAIQVDGPETYARKYGYAYVLLHVGTEFQLVSIATGDTRGLPGIRGLSNLVSRIGNAVLYFQTRTAIPVARDYAQDAPWAGQVLSYNDGTRKGSIEIADAGVEARARLIAQVGALCSTKNRALVAHPSALVGARFATYGEYVRDGHLRVDFECLD